MCHQSVGLIARALEMQGIATSVVAWKHGRIRIVGVPRAVLTPLSKGLAFGAPGDREQQQTVLDMALELLEQDGPLAPVRAPGLAAQSSAAQNRIQTT